MAFTKIQSTAFATATAASLNQTFGTPTLAGSLLVAFVNCPPGNPTGVTDDKGNTWKPLGTPLTANISQIYYLSSSTVGTSVVTATSNQVSNNMALSIAEYTGQLVSHPADSHAGNASSTLQPRGGVVAQQAGDLIVQEWTTNGGAKTWSSITGITAETATTTVPSMWGDNLSGIAGNNVTGANVGVSPDTIGQIGAFLPATFTVPPGINVVRGIESGVKVLTGVQSSIAALFAGGNQVNNAILAIVIGYNFSTNQVTGVTDTAGNTYSLLAFQHGANTLNAAISIYIANPIVGFDGNNTVTATVTNQSYSTLSMSCVEISGQAVSPLDTSILVNSATTTKAYSITAAAANELIITIGSATSGALWTPTGQTDISTINLTNTDGSPTVLLEVAASKSVLGSNAMSITFGSASYSVVALALKAATPVYSISGSLGASGAGATVSWTGASSGSTTADGSGNYNTGILLIAGSYTITPTKFGFTFTPTSSPQTVTNNNITGVNFTANAPSTAAWMNRHRKLVNKR